MTPTSLALGSSHCLVPPQQAPGNLCQILFSSPYIFPPPLGFFQGGKLLNFTVDHSTLMLCKLHRGRATLEGPCRLHGELHTLIRSLGRAWLFPQLEGDHGADEWQASCSNEGTSCSGITARAMGPLCQAKSLPLWTDKQSWQEEKLSHGLTGAPWGAWGALPYCFEGGEGNGKSPAGHYSTSWGSMGPLMKWGCTP